MQLTTCQQNALKILEGPDNVFLTGVAGSGKSFLLQYFLQNKDRKTHSVVASTGSAAVLVGGVTFHSFFGLGILEGGIEKTVDRSQNDKRLKKRLRQIHLVVIDEISMIPGQALEAAEIICRKLRDNSLPWGGIKIVVVGDFGQLPPVNVHGNDKDWSFHTRAWKTSMFQVAYLDTIVRTEDKEFLQVLNSVRNGVVDATVTDFLNSRVCKPHSDFAGTCVYPHRLSVEQFNLNRLETLPGEIKRIETAYYGTEKYLDRLRKSAPIPEVLQLKEDAIVMMRKNDPRLRYTNGSLGKVRKINSDILEIELLGELQSNAEASGIHVEIKRETFSFLDADGEVVASATNFPINLAWATTIHKCQGMSLDMAVMDLSKVFEFGQAYVALSRMRSSKGLFLTSWNPKAIRVAPEVLNFHASLNI